MSPISQTLADMPFPDLAAPCCLGRSNRPEAVRFSNGAIISEHGGRLRVTCPDGVEKTLCGSLRVERDWIRICFGDWNQLIRANGEHELCRITADFSRREALRASFLRCPGGAPAYACEQHFFGTDFRPARAIEWRMEGEMLVLSTSLGDTLVEPAVPLDWALN